MNNPICKKIYKLIKKYDEIVIARHIGPDPDAIASQLALRDSIKLSFPSKKVYAVGLSVAKYKYYGHLDKVNELELQKPLLIVLDLPNKARVDGIDFNKYQEVIKIDHHPFEETMGEVEWIDEESSSTSELIAQLFFATKLITNNDIYKTLLLGIASDSERFLLNNTTAKTHYVVYQIMLRSNIDLNELYSHLYEKPLVELRFQGYISENIIVNNSGFAHILITPEIIKKYNVDVSSASNMINSFNFVKEILVWSFVTYDEKGLIYKVNIRSRGPIINDIASKYNGGGHKLASGCRIKELQDVNKLFEELDKVCQEYRDLKDGNKEV